MERVAYYNGQILPESQVRIPFRDSAAIRGVGVYDTERTFAGSIFKLQEHLARLWRSLAYVRIPPPLPQEELAAITAEVVAHNLPIEGRDLWVTQRISRGAPVHEGGDGRPTVIVECLPIPWDFRAPYFRDGVNLRTPTARRTPPWALSPQAKTTNLLNLWVADQEVLSQDPRAWPLLTDEFGCLAEGAGANVFIVRDGIVMTPPARHVLPGITRDTVIALAADLGIPLLETPVDLFLAATADEIFITSTSLCICPAASLNGAPVLNPAIPGPITRRLQNAFSDLVGVDVVAQYLAHMVDPVAIDA
ncbi:MAG: aminotransferase class IV [Thermomicrobiales bacterium]